jgi:phosphoesterase RecJ-like protein
VSSFPTFLADMHGKNLLHLGHKEADCDALGSAYALSCLLPGDLGFTGGLKPSVQDLAEWLGISALIDPDPAAYDYVFVYDTYTPSLLGFSLPARYALFGHHQPGGHRFGDLRSELAGDATWAWVRPVDSTCSLLVDLFQAHAVALNPKMAVALAAGVLTDTLWLQQADAGTLRRLATALEAADLFVEDVVTVIDSPRRRATRMPIVMDAVRSAAVSVHHGWSVMATTMRSPEYGFAVVDAMKKLGGDINIVAFPRADKAMVMAECRAVVVQQTDLSLLDLMEEVARAIGAEEVWGTSVLGRVVAATSPEELMTLCVGVIAGAS